MFWDVFETTEFLYWQVLPILFFLPKADSEGHSSFAQCYGKTVELLYKFILLLSQTFS